uniref:3-hydroxyisobutyryl-CoA hydrolase n=1 Tax=Mucochytrium quahogii TaxID=96639 RepID=A0A7S2R8E1_9STRA|mmetsp:Transcript_12491/g.22632  ORF Transcript_12491/g.22632 Transcript_12491/m.22632 type:complete len:415 (-) Transcript_12491:3042-4286(-)
MHRISTLRQHISRNKKNCRAGVQQLGCSFSTMTEAEDQVLFRDIGDLIKGILLNRPKKFNALNLNMVREITPVYSNYIACGKTKLVLMTGAGDKAFCAGGDITDVRESTLAGGSLGYDFFFEEYQLNHCIATAFEKTGLIQVALLDGVDMGGGVGLSHHGKVRVATEKTTFAMPETAIGLFPDVGGTYALTRLKSGKAMGLYLGLTGVRLGAADCLWSGIATHYIPRANLGKLEVQLAALGENVQDINAVNGVLDELRGGEDPPQSGKASPVLLPHLEGIEECFSFETIEEIVAALEKYARDNAGDSQKKNWAETTLQTLGKVSPLSLKITIEALHRHSLPTVTIGDALINEYRIVQRMCDKDGDFFEGVRALLVDKDMSPKWNHASVEDVPQELVDSFFEPLPTSHPRGELRL